MQIHMNLYICVSVLDIAFVQIILLNENIRTTRQYKLKTLDSFYICIQLLLKFLKRRSHLNAGTAT